MRQFLQLFLYLPALGDIVKALNAADNHTLTVGQYVDIFPNRKNLTVFFSNGAFAIEDRFGDVRR